MAEKEQKNTGGKLICGSCGKPAKRLLSPPIPPEKGRHVRTEGLLCESCLAVLEEEYAQEQAEPGDTEEP
jgi:hypothetical protein